jgi:hypothetical protein
MYVDEHQKIGWHTNVATRPVMIDSLAEEYADFEGYTMRDKRCVTQAISFVDKKTRAEGETYDDFVMADAIAGRMRQVPRGKSWRIITPEDIEAAQAAKKEALLKAAGQ